MTETRSLPMRLVQTRAAIAVAIFLFAALLRVGVLWQLADLPTFLFPQTDELAAHESALACAQGKGLTDSYYKAPLYMYLLAGTYKLFGPTPYYARLIQTLVCSLSAVLLFLIGDRLFGRTVGIVSGVIGATYWVFILRSVELVDASIASLIYLLALYPLVAMSRRRTWQWALVGVLIGLGAITRPNILAFAPILAVAVFVVILRRGTHPLEATGVSSASRARRLRQALACAVALTLGCCAVIAPVTLRNRVVSGDWVLIGTYGGLNFWVANSPYSDGKNVCLLPAKTIPPLPEADPNDVWSHADLNSRIATHLAQEELGRPVRRAQVSTYCLQRAAGYIKDDPHKFVTDLARRLVYFFNAYEFATVRDPYRVIRHSGILSALSFFHYGIFAPLMVLGVVSAIRMRPRPVGVIYALLMLGALLAGGIFFAMNSRFRLPLVYLATPFAAYGIVVVASLCRRGRLWSERLVAVVVLVAVGVLSNVDFLNYKPPYHTDLRFAEVLACYKADRQDMLGDAVRRLDEALTRDAEDDRPDWSTVLVPFAPNSALFAHYCRVAKQNMHQGSGDLQRAIRCGTKMVLKERFHPDLCKQFFRFLAAAELPQYSEAVYDMLVKSGRLKQARMFLELVSPRLPPVMGVRCNLRFARQFRNPEALSRAAELLGKVRKDEPLYEELRRHLHQAAEALGMQVRIPTSSPSRSTTQSTSGDVPDWIAALHKPRPKDPKAPQPKVYDLLAPRNDDKIATPSEWQARRKRLLEKWTTFLGTLPRPPLEPKIHAKVELPGRITRTLLEIQVEPGIWMRCYLFEPHGKGPFPAVVCLHSTTDETIDQPAGLGKQPEKAFALDLVKRGYVTIAPENFEWRYPGRPTTGKAWDKFHAVARRFLQTHPGVTGMAKMVHDASRAVDYLLTLPNVRKNRIGTIGHSLGAKEVTYLMAFDERVVAGVSSEGGVAFEFTNYHDPWYLGRAIKKPDCDLYAHEVPALVAPRAWLLIGGNSADGDKSWPYVRPVLDVYRLLGKPANVGLFVHTKGHAVPPEARSIAFKWLDYHLKS